MWVIGDLFQQYAAKYVGISRGIPLSNTNQLWGLAWGILVFGELRGRGLSLYAEVVGGSVLMAAGAGAIALSSVSAKEHGRWGEAAHREGDRYGVASDYVQAGLAGEECTAAVSANVGRSWLDWGIVLVVTAIFVALAGVARVPNIAVDWRAVALLSAILVVVPGRLRKRACGRPLASADHHVASPPVHEQPPDVTLPLAQGRLRPLPILPPALSEEVWVWRGVNRDVVLGQTLLQNRSARAAYGNPT